MRVMEKEKNKTHERQVAVALDEISCQGCDINYRITYSTTLVFLVGALLALDSVVVRDKAVFSRRVT